MDITRFYPLHKSKIQYPIRCDLLLKNYQQMTNDKEFMEKYNKVKSGIDYRTDKRILRNGVIHKKLMKELSKEHNIALMDGGLKKINIEQYLNDSKRIYREIDDENKEIEKYNHLVDKTINEIRQLKSWNDFVEFDGKKYGIQKIFENVHRENDCNGAMNYYGSEFCQCFLCNNFDGCGSKGLSFYQCENCQYIEVVY